MKTIFFPTQSDLRKWFEENHEHVKEIWVGYYKKATGIESIDWSQSVDEALCFGWIDGIRKSVDDKSYKIRFTPRNPKSHWSAVNLKKMEVLQKKGLITEAGLEVFNLRDKTKSEHSSYEQKVKKLPAEYENKIKVNIKAYKFYKELAPSYKKATIHWIVSAKKEETKLRRLQILIQSCEENLKVPLLRNNKK
ncbi:MAG: bacteriocin-protection protein [Calditrichaeota bacterium]|nr:MAG: bacteriocin-protection protein [Calditrichota bacterium]MBL1205797.1 bacteriocin-protection protein [Calditrichota bacterium]NOG45625.1 bacteriocin-protection protein [Calditrichota bacterium]